MHLLMFLHILFLADFEIPAFVDITENSVFPDIPSGTFLSIRDYDNDGYEDILIDNRLLKNIGGIEPYFFDVTEYAGLMDAKGHGTFLDIDDNGCYDLMFYGQKAGVQLYKNNCNGTFSNISDNSVLKGCVHTEAITYFYLPEFKYPFVYCANYEYENEYFKDALYASNGDGTFYDASYLINSLMFQVATPSRCAVSADFNNDSFTDIYVCNYRLFPNTMYVYNDGIFTNEAYSLGAASIKTENNRMTMGSQTIGVTFQDLNNDGILELIISNLAHNDYERGMYNLRSQILRLNKEGRLSYKDIRNSSGIVGYETGKNINGRYLDELFSAVISADFNNDSLPDILFSQVYENEYSYARFFTGVNDVDIRFAESTFASGLLFYDSMGVVYSDLNKDGCLDLVVAGKRRGDKNRRLFIFENVCNYKSDFIGFKLIGRRSNSFATGSRVRVYITKDGERRILTRYVESTSSTAGQQNTGTIYFGFPKNTNIERIEVEWSSGIFQILYDFKINGLNTVIEPRMNDLPVLEDLIKYDEEYYSVKYRCLSGSECYLFSGNSCENSLIEIEGNLLSRPENSDNYCKNFILILNDQGIGRKFLIDKYVYN